MLLNKYFRIYQEEQPSEGGASGSGNPEHQNLDNQNKTNEPLNKGQSEPQQQTEQPKFPDNWRDLMAGEDEKLRKQLERYSAPDSFAKSYRELQRKMSSGEVLHKLPENPTEDELKQWRKENNVPDEVTKYFDGMELSETDKPIFESFAQAMQQANVPQSQFKAAIEWYKGFEQQEIDRQNEHASQMEQKAEDELRNEWGADYRKNINLINGIVNQLPEETKNLFSQARMPDGSFVLSNPGFLRWMSDVARKVNPVGTIIPGATNPAAITDELSQLKNQMGDPNSDYWKNPAKQQRYRELLEASESMK